MQEGIRYRIGVALALSLGFVLSVLAMFATLDRFDGLWFYGSLTLFAALFLVVWFTVRPPEGA